MGEIIIIGIGQCGIKIATTFVERLNYDHCLDAQHFIKDKNRYNAKLKVFYDELQSGQYIPRLVYVDLDSNQIEKCLVNNSIIVNPNYCFFDKQSSGNIYANSIYQNGAVLSNRVNETLDNIWEQCHNVQGIMMFYSTQGGSGSGLSCNLMSYFRRKDPSKIVHCIPVFPRELIENPSYSIYNTVFSLYDLIERIDYATVYDNKALNKLCSKNNYDSTFENFNLLISESLIQQTSIYRLKGDQIGGMKKIATTMIPFPRFKFFSTRYSDVKQIDNYNYNLKELMINLQELCSLQQSNQNQNNESFMSSLISVNLLQRGQQLDLQQIIGNMEKYNKHTSYSFNQVSVQHNDYENIIGVLINSKYFDKYFKIYAEQFKVLYQKRAYIHYYTMAGMDEMEFNEAISSVKDLISEYREMYTWMN